MKIEILAIGRSPAIMTTLLRLINKNENWHGNGAQTDVEAMAIFDRVRPAIVMFTNGINSTSEHLLRSYFTKKKNDIIIIQHYGGGSGLLTNEILHALAHNVLPHNAT